MSTQNQTNQAGPDVLQWATLPDGLSRVTRFSINDASSERVYQFLTSSERKAQVHNINRYWMARRMNLDYSLELGAIIIFNDSNLSSRITTQQRERSDRLIALPEFLVGAISKVVRYGAQFCSRAERFVGLCRLRKRIQGIEAHLKDPLKVFPFGTWINCAERLREEPIGTMLAGWPERTLLMLHAADVIQHHAPPQADYWRVLEIGSGPAMLSGLLMGAFGSRHVCVDLPEQIVVGFSFLSEFYPGKRLLLPHEAAALGDASEEYDLVFLTPEQLAFLGDRRFDIAINMFSFQEMANDTIAEYFELIRERLLSGGVFYCANRIEKFNPHDGSTADFARYPWLPEDEFLFDQNMESVPGARSYHRESLVRMAVTTPKMSAATRGK